MFINLLKDIHLILCQEMSRAYSTDEFNLLIEKIERVHEAPNKSKNYRIICEDFITFMFSQDWRPLAKARNVKYSKEILGQLKAEFRDYKNIIKKIEEESQKGIDLWPRLSRLITKDYINKALNKDPLHRKWGFHHFHLGEKNHHVRKDLIESSKELLFCKISDKIIYFLVIGNHNSFKNFDYQELINISISNWGNEYLAILNGISDTSKLSPENLYNIHSYNVNTIFSGGHFTSPVNLAGIPVEYVQKFDIFYDEIKKIGSFIKSELEKYSEYKDSVATLQSITLSNHLNIHYLEGTIADNNHNNIFANFKLSVNEENINLLVTPFNK